MAGVCAVFTVLTKRPEQSAAVPTQGVWASPPCSRRDSGRRTKRERRDGGALRHFHSFPVSNVKHQRWWRKLRFQLLTPVQHIWPHPLWWCIPFDVGSQSQCLISVCRCKSVQMNIEGCQILDLYLIESNAIMKYRYFSFWPKKKVQTDSGKISCCFFLKK